jgi:hypothetical protein
MPTVPTRGDVIRQLDEMRGALRIAIDTIKKLESNRYVDTAAVIKHLNAVRNEAAKVRRAINPETKK